MEVLVTGSSGKVGRAAVSALKAAGHGVTGADRVATMDQNQRTIACDCADYGQVVGLMGGVDIHPRPEAVVHLAGIPSPGLAPDATIFTNNMVSTYNVFHAAARAGIRRIVWASSETIHGLPLDNPDFVPIDESHSVTAKWSYSLSKALGETMADEMVRWYPGLTIVSLRISHVYAPEDYGARAAIIADPALRKANLWSYVDARDVGEACRLATEASLEGHERLIIAAADNIVGMPSSELMERWFPGVPVHGALEGTQSLLSSKRAEKLIGYKPRHGWRDL